MEKKLLELFATFAKIGAFTFGGGYAMIPLIQREVVDKRHWVGDKDILDIVAIAESTPGPIAINSATFIGHRVAGTRGAICATLGVVLPSFAIILAVSSVLRASEGLRVVRYAFWGIRAGVLALILKALCRMYVNCPKSGFSCAVMLMSMAAVALFHVNAMLVIGVAAACGMAYSRIRKA